jgi:hypothetical protein
MRLFKKREKAPLSTGQQAAAQRIAEKLISGQKRLAGYLNTKTQGISGRGWLFLLIGFCLLFGSYCLQLILRAWD